MPHSFLEVQVLKPKVFYALCCHAFATYTRMHVEHAKTGCKCGDPTSHPDIVSSQTQALSTSIDSSSSAAATLYASHLLGNQNIGSPDIMSDIVSVMQQCRPCSKGLKADGCESKESIHVNMLLGTSTHGIRSLSESWIAEISQNMPKVPTAQDLTLPECEEFANGMCPSALCTSAVFLRRIGLHAVSSYSTKPISSVPADPTIAKFSLVSFTLYSQKSRLVVDPFIPFLCTDLSTCHHVFRYLEQDWCTSA